MKIISIPIMLEINRQSRINGRGSMQPPKNKFAPQSTLVGHQIITLPFSYSSRCVEGVSVQFLP